MESSKPRALAAFAAAEGRAGILVDFDGSLSPIVARPELAQIREGARDALARLAGRYAVVAVVSGRTRAELETLIGVPGVTLAALYGIEDDTTLPQGLEDRVRAIAATIPGIRVEPKGGSIATHYRGASDPEAAEAALAEALASIAAETGMELIEGKKVLELVPAGRPLKGGAVERIVADAALDAVLYAGDDQADLKAFEVLDRLAADGLVTVKVAVHGPETPAALTATADVVVDGPAGLVGLLRRL
ncbi:MAG TPA: trehalose-phosphatase [Actinomycetota bacterium]|jgi:trehalose 6-phosphate phosphatase